MFNIKANDEVIAFCQTPDELEEFLDEHEEISKRHGYELKVNDQPIHTLEHPIPALVSSLKNGSLDWGVYHDGSEYGHVA